MKSMNVGFSTLSLFMKSLEEMFEIATKDGFEYIEILCEGPYHPSMILSENKEIYSKFGINPQSMNVEINSSYDLNIYLHCPTVDLNPASMNSGIRAETIKQTKETLDLAIKLGAVAITTHPGIVHRKESRIRDMAINYTIESLKKCSKYAEECDIGFSIENMPNTDFNNGKYLGNSPQEHKHIIEEVGSLATIDWGHANTNNSPEKFLEIEKANDNYNITYFHLNDNNGNRDQHLSLGKGNADFSYEFLENVRVGIIELNDYSNVLKSREFLNDTLKSNENIE